MLIRSQDKRKITNFNLVTDLIVSKNRINTYDVLACYPYFAESDCGFVTLGTYSTEEKAIKVLDMIQSAYNTIETMKIDKQVRKDNHYFEVPQDSEV